jgi:DNA-binding NarL/FixJ family response regulator
LLPPRPCEQVTIELLVGRDSELAVLAEAAEEARAGRGSVVLVAGDAGVGKTVLSRCALGDCGLRVFEAAARPAGTAPYGPLVAVLRAHRRHNPSAPDADGLLAKLATAPHPERATVLERLATTFVSACGERPTGVLLDDLQWADEGTLELTVGLAPLVESEPVLVIGTYRSDEMTRAHPLRRLRSELRRQRRLHEISLGPLPADETGVLLERVCGDRVAHSLVAAVLDRTGGVPFFVEELGAALLAGGRLRSGTGGLELRGREELPLPDNVRDAVLLRAAGLDDATHNALGVAAALGQRFDPDLAAALSGLDGWPSEALRRGVVVEDSGGCLAFRHDLVREAFYDSVPWAQRPALHRQIAERLQNSGAPLTTVAQHWADGREPDRARRAFLRAADEFCAVYACRDGARAIRRALDLWPEGGEEPDRLDALERLGEAAQRAGDLTGSLRAWREAASERRSRGEPGPLGHVLRGVAGVLELQGRWEDALEARQQAAEAFAEAARPADAANERLAAAAHLRSAASFRASLMVLEHARADAIEAQRPDIEARVLGLEGNVRARMGEGAPAVALVQTALALALEHSLTGAAAEVYQRLADSYEHAGEYRAARATYKAAFGYCSANALEPMSQLCLACLTVVLCQAGDWAQAESLCRQVLQAPATTPHGQAVASGTLGLILALRGQHQSARPLLLESATVAHRIELAAMELLSGWGLAMLDQARSAAAAADRCRVVLEHWQATEERHYVISPLRWAATVFAEADDSPALRACTAALTQIAADTGQDEASSAVAHALGEIALLGGDNDQAAAHFQRALNLLAELAAPLERVESQRRAAVALAAAGRREDAIESLVAAHRTARRLRARPLTERLARDLQALDAQADRRLGRLAAAQAQHGGLTRRELDVIRLVATGRTDREIAGQLFLSHRTVEHHVRSIRMKLDCRSRTEAARRAVELGLLTDTTTT